MSIELDDFFNTDKKEFYNLRDRYIEPPFSVLDSKNGNWQRRKDNWKKIGIKSEIGRNITGRNNFNDSKLINHSRKKLNFSNEILKINPNSIFDPVLCEIIYTWFCPKDGNIFDPFAGGSVRGIVANYLGYKYTGIELREEQVLSNKDQSLEILSKDNQPNWIVGDSDSEIDKLVENNVYDLLFTCPPYHDLEVYSNNKDDLSNMNYTDFIIKYESIIKKSYSILKNNSYACIVVGEIRDKKGFYKGFIPDTIQAFKKAGFQYYNEMILLNAIGSARIRCQAAMKNKKITKVHQNILVFKKV